MFGSRLGASCSASQVQIEARVTDELAKFANQGGDLLERDYEDEGLHAMAVADASLPPNAPNTARADALGAALEGVRKKWAPIWNAWDKFAIAEGVYATQLEQGGAPSAGRVLSAYCAVVAVAPPELRDELKTSSVPCAPADGGA